MAILEDINEAVSRCSKCGFCQAGCPVYKASGLEWTVARGRLALIRDVIEGKLDLDDEIKEPLFNCLTCNGCQAQCPPAVPTAELVTRAREELVRRYGLPTIQKLIFKEALSNPGVLNIGARMLRSTQAAHLLPLAELLKLNTLMGPLGKDQNLLPPVSHRPARELLKRSLRKVTAPKYRVAYFIGCATNYFYPRVARSLVRVLQTQQVEVLLPSHFCCGKPPSVYGDTETTRDLARRNVERLESLGVDAVVTDCATCGSFLKTYPAVLEGDEEYGARATALAAKIKDISQFLTEIGFTSPEKEVSLKVTYHDPCHLGRFQKLTKEPRALIKGLSGIDFRECAEADMCCGGAGSYSLTHYDLSTKILDRKMANVARTGADVLVTSCPACMLQLERGFKLHNHPGRVVHLLELLDPEKHIGR